MTEYTVRHELGCVLIFGAVPFDVLAAVSKTVPEDAVIDPQAAQVTGANFACGLPQDLQVLIARHADGALLRARQKYAQSRLSEDAIRWVAVGQRGLSSEAMFSCLTGVNVERDGFRRGAHPRDPDDLRRCLLLLDQVPELKPQLQKMASVSPVWQALVEHWMILEAEFELEAPNWRSGGRWTAPQTAAAMQRLIEGANG